MKQGFTLKDHREVAENIRIAEEVMSRIKDKVSDNYQTKSYYGRQMFSKTEKILRELYALINVCNKCLEETLPSEYSNDIYYEH